MEVKLLQASDIDIAIKAVRTCYDSFDKSKGLSSDISLVDTVCNDYKHKSVVEHIVFSFEIKGISRLNAIELTRHRIASYSIKSTRFTLKELVKEKDLDNNYTKYINLSGNETIDKLNIQRLKDLKQILESNVKNDIAKYALPECYKTDVIWTINARSLCNFFELRLSRSAHQEIRQLARMIYDVIPIQHQFLFKKCNNQL